MPSNRSRIAVVGVGYSTVGRRTGLSVRQLTAQACTAALDDAELSRSAIDGLSAMGGEALDAAYMLGCTPLSWFSNAGVGPAFVHPFLQSIAAISAGLCTTCIALRVITEETSTPATIAARVGNLTADDAQFKAPFGALAGVHWAGLFKRRYMAEFGATEEQFGALAIAQREWAARNHDALFRSPLTLDDYLGSRYVSDPLRLLDCDYPCDAAGAVILTTEERAADLSPRSPVFVESFALTGLRDLNFELIDDMATTAPAHCARQLWSKTSLRSDDVDCAQLYDGFTVMTMQWLEALGFCGRGEAGPFVADGSTRLGGVLPMNTDGGACNVGRRHGTNYCIEAVRQLRGEAGERQVRGANVSVFTTGVGPFAGAVLLTNE
jgi:acetyl-CoA acetyltransferase